MIFGEGLGTLILLGLWIFCIIDVITTAESEVRNLPKAIWLLIVIVLFDLGSIAWLLAGRNWNKAAAKAAPRGADSGHPAFGRPDRSGQPGRSLPTNPDDDEDFLRSLRLRAEEQRRSLQKKRADELKDEDDGHGKPPADGT